MLRFHSLALACASAGCLLLIGTALLPRETPTASDIDDLRTSDWTYQGRRYSNTSAALEGDTFQFIVNFKNGKNFNGISATGGGGINGTISGSVSTSGKLKAEIVPGIIKVGTGRGIGPAGTFTSIKLKGQLSATGEAIIGTYTTKGIVDKGTFTVVAIPDP